MPVAAAIAIYSLVAAIFKCQSPIYTGIRIMIDSELAIYVIFSFKYSGFCVAMAMPMSSPLSAVIWYTILLIEYLYSVTFNVVKNMLLFANNKGTEHVYFPIFIYARQSPKITKPV